jgi:hypothetical protein
MYESNDHATQLKISTLNFIDGTITMRYLMPFVKFYMIASRDESISYNLSQLSKKYVIVSSLPLNNLL